MNFKQDYNYPQSLLMIHTFDCRNIVWISSPSKPVVQRYLEHNVGLDVESHQPADSGRHGDIEIHPSPIVA